MKACIDDFHFIGNMFDVILAVADLCCWLQARLPRFVLLRQFSLIFNFMHHHFFWIMRPFAQRSMNWTLTSLMIVHNFCKTESYNLISTGSQCGVFTGDILHVKFTCHFSQIVLVCMYKRSPNKYRCYCRLSVFHVRHRSMAKVAF